MPAAMVEVAAVVEHRDAGRRGRSGSSEDVGIGEECGDRRGGWAA
jgi:hypothetical protein